MTRLSRLLAISVAIALTTAGRPVTLLAQQRGTQPAASGPVDTTHWRGLDWRLLGPAHTGRMTSVVGSTQRPAEYYVGTTGGGVWKTSDAGKTWFPMTDKYFGGTIGAVDVYKKNPDIVWAGGGETPIRGNVSYGDGVWKSLDGGKTWSDMGLAATRYISRVLIHPSSPDIVYVGALGHVFGPNAERGVYRTRDGGKTWSKVLFVNDSTGVADLAMDPKDPDVLYAGFWQAGRKPWLLVSGGEGSGLWKTTDGGDHWTDISRSPGLPAKIWGNIGIAISPANPQRVWALIEADSGGLYRSDDGGKTWKFLNGDRNLRQRAWYFTKITADPKDTNTVYAGNVGGFVSHDGGKTFRSGLGNGDTHDYWIAPDDPKRIAVAGDPGVVIDDGKTTTRANIPTGQYYHVHLTNAVPYDVCGAEQDGGVDCFPIREAGGRGGRGGRGGAAATPPSQWNFTTRYGGAGGESGYVVSDPLDPDVTFGGNYSGVLEMQNHRTGQSERLDPWPLNPMGHDASDSKYRFQWTFPIMNSPNDPMTLYVGSNVLFRSRNLGQSWQVISPDLTRHDPATLGASGGPLTKDQTSVEYYGTIFAVQESPVKRGLVWTGSDDGLIYLSRDVNLPKPVWSNVTPKDLPRWTRISIVEPSPHRAGTMYFAANRYEMDDDAPYLYRTTDYGVTWHKIVNGIPPHEFTRAIREDLQRPGLLYAATERGMYISYDAGDHWQSLQLDLPPVAVHDIALRGDDIVIATMGRGFYAMEGIAPLRVADKLAADTTCLFQPADAYRGDGTVRVQYHLPVPGDTVTLELLDAKGRVMQKVSSADTAATRRGGFGGRGGAAATARVTDSAGPNQYNLSLRYPDGTNFRGAIFWDGNGLNGPVAAPGTYSVRMTVNGHAPATRTFRVRKDPQTTASDSDITAQVDFLLRIRDTVSAANNAVRTIRNVREQLDSAASRLTGSAAATFAPLMHAFDDSLTQVEQTIYQTHNEAGEDPLNFPIRLNNQIGALADFVASGERRPPQQAYDVWNDLVPQLNAQLIRLHRVLTGGLPPINAVLRAASQPAIVPSTAERPEPARAARTGGADETVDQR